MCKLMSSGSGVTLPQPEISDIVKKWNEDVIRSNITDSHYQNKHLYYGKEQTLTDHNNIKLPQIIISTPSEFFNALEINLKMKKQTEGLMIRKGEMYSGKLSEVFPDCTSSRMWIKQGAKEYENMLLMLERWDAILCSLYGCANVFSAQLRNYWRKILFIAMHDALPGTGKDDVYREIQDTFDSIDDTIRKSLSDSDSEIHVSLYFEYRIVV